MSSSCIPRLDPVQEEPGRGAVGRCLAALLPQDGTQPRWQIVSLQETASTNDVAYNLALAGAAEWTVVVADAQTSGRGRQGRVWHSAPNAGLWCSVVLRPPVPLADLGPLTLVLAVAARRAAAALGAGHVRIKWPNDLMCAGRKLAGILTESRGGGSDAPPEFVIAGIGVNITTPAGGFPESVAGTAVALDQCISRQLDAAGYGASLLREIVRAYQLFLTEGFQSLRAEWMAFADFLGQEVTISGAGSPVAGCVEDINEAGQLVLRGHGGQTILVSAGDVIVRPDRDRPEPGRDSC